MIFADSDSCKKGRKEEDLFVNYICGSGAADVLHADVLHADVLHADVLHADAVFLLFLVDHQDFCHQ
jgi:hypothetical protein